MTDNETAANSFEEIALCLASGFEPTGAEMGARGRVVILFADPHGRCSEVLKQHRLTGALVNSQLFEDGLRRARRLVFSAKDGVLKNGDIHNGARFQG